MRSTAASLALIVLALAAIAGGYLSGAAGTHPPRTVVLHASASPHVRAVIEGSSDAAVDDVFSDDDVVVDRRASSGTTYTPQLAVVVGLCGESAPLDGGFLELGIPVALDLDPNGADAARTAKYAHESSAPLLIHVTVPPSPAALDAFRRRFGPIEGIASQSSTGMAAALSGTGLAFFDERGDAPPAAFAVRGVRLLARDETVDNRAFSPYIDFMLDRAAIRARTQGPIVVVLRPVPVSLQALEKFMQTRSAQIVPLTQTR